MTSSASQRLADWTTFRIGGPADQLVVARTEADLLAIVQQTDQTGRPLLILSGGSNILVADEGFPGTVVVVATTGMVATGSDTDGVRLRVAAGEIWDDLVAHCVNQGWSGLEMLSGIPGRVGAAPIQNIGAYGADVASAITQMRVFDRQANRVTHLSATDCEFGYRNSVLKASANRYVVLEVEFHLRPSRFSSPVAYAQLAQHLGVDVGETTSTVAVRQAVLQLRRSKGMVLDPADPDTFSAGSFFTNPVIDQALAACLPDQAPRFDQPGGLVKTSAAWLIDHAGFHKGFGDGQARLSTKHVLALTNRGQATAAEVIALARTVRSGVFRTFGIHLTPEPILIGLSLDDAV